MSEHELGLFDCPGFHCEKKLREVKGRGIDGGKCPSCRTQFRVRENTLVECPTGENGYFPFFTVAATEQDLEHQKQVRKNAELVESTSGRLTLAHVM